MTPEQLARATGATLANAARFAPHFTEAMQAFAINTPTRRAMFLAQIGHETAKLSTTEENLRYRAANIRRLGEANGPGSRWAAAAKRADELANNPEALANFVYGGRFGNRRDGDGWKYRGRGGKMLTFYDNYKLASDGLRHITGDNYLDYPDLVAEPKGAAWTSAHFWVSKGLNAAADAGDYVKVSNVIQGNLSTLKVREAALRIAMPEVGTWAA
jgi:putative chitinase